MTDKCMENKTISSKATFQLNVVITYINNLSCSIASYRPGCKHGIMINFNKAPEETSDARSILF